MAVDPGGVSGVTYGLVPQIMGGTVREHLAGARVWSAEVGGSPLEQATEICLDYLSFVFDAQVRWQVSINNVCFVWESFQLRRRNVELSPLEIRNISEGLMYKHNFPFELQTASQAKTYATDDRLRKWGQWVKGSAHQRDARRHLALKINTILAKS
jgi:hypothetical protein